MKAVTTIGLEVAADQVRAVEVSRAAGEVRILRTAEVSLPAGSVIDGRVIDPLALSRALRELWETARFSERRCVIVMPSRLMTQQMITVPPAPPLEQIAIVRGELERFGTIEERGYFGWLPMTAGAGIAGNTLAFLMHDGVVEGYETALRQADLQADGFEPAALAALRVLARREAVQEGPPVLPIMGGDLPSLPTVRGTGELGEPSGSPVMIARRRGYFALRDLRDKAARRGEACLHTARRAPYAGHDRREGGPATAVVYASGQCAALVFFEGGGICYCRDLEAGLDEAPGAIDGGNASDVVRAFVSEIERSLQYYRRAYKEAPQPRRLLLAGDHPAIAPAVAWLSESQSVEVLRVHPLAGAADVEGTISLYGADRGHEGIPSGHGDPFVAAVGGALRRIDPAGIDLKIARELREEATAQDEAAARYRRTTLATAGTIAVVGALATSLLTVRLRQAQVARDAAFAAAQAARESRKASTLRQQNLEDDLRRLRRRRPPVTLLLHRLQRAVPGGIALTALELREDGTLLLRGEAKAAPLVRDLVHRLTEDPRFRAPELDSLEAPEEQGSVLFAVRTGWPGYGVQAALQP
jgi:Tfp pilus assembly PilM family ATPase